MRRAFLVTLFWAALTPHCKKANDAWIERYKRSVRSDVDLYLVPERYAVLESSWLKKTAVARYNKDQLAQSLAEYGRSLDDVKKNPAYAYKESGTEAQMKVGRISHSTAYDYDANIPLAFYGKWFTPQQNSTIAYQQHITPTLAKILGVRNPNGVEVEALPILSGEKTKPDIIVVAVIDQGGRELLRVHRSAAPRIHALLGASANLTAAQVGHLDAHTAVGHMAIGTGAFPIKSSVIGNTFFAMDRNAGKEHLRKDEIYATRDESQVNPSELKSETLADVLNKVNGGRSVIASQSYALRAAIGMAGHGLLNGVNNHVYWLDAGRSKWITDKRYYNVPQAAQASDVLLKYMKYYPQGFEGYAIRDTKAALENWGVMMSTPAETQLEGELIRAVITQEIIEKKKDADGFTDLIYVSFKSADAVGHHFGYHSLEARDTLTAIDAEIGALQDFLSRQYGDRFILVLTADHGCAPVSEISGGARLTVEEVINAIDVLLPPEVRANESLVRFMTVGQVSLNHELMKKHGITIPMITGKIMALTPDGKKFFNTVLTRKDLGLDS